jgi:predicted acyl esterase
MSQVSGSCGLSGLRGLRGLRRLYCVIVFGMWCHSLHGFTVRTEMISMRDSVRLATDIYQPVTSKSPWPVIMMRTPYNRSSAMDPALALIVCDLMHYAVVIQNTRGRYGSEGVDSLYFSDGWGMKQDGYDTVEWIASRPWSNGKIGTWGASALGMTQYLLAGAAPPSLDCCVVMVAASNFYGDALFYGGVYREAMVDGWLNGNNASHLIDFFSEHALYEPLYDYLNLLTRLDSIRVPILHIGGWHDIFVQGQINAFKGLQEKGGPGAFENQKLIIGPWVHSMTNEKTGDLAFPNSNAFESLLDMLDWFNYYLNDNSESLQDMPAVRYYLMGDPEYPQSPGNRWISAPAWPPEYISVPLYLRAGERLGFNPPDGQDGSDSFLFDPDDPVPTIGGRNLNIPAGTMDQRDVESRADVLVYTSEPVEDSLVIAGPVSVTLFASTNALDTDFTAKLCDVYPDGRSMLIADGIIRARFRETIREERFIVPGEVYEYQIDLWSTAVAFASGHRIRLSVSSSNSPRFAVNPNTGEPFRKETGRVIAQQTVYYTEQFPSALNLPVVSGYDPGTGIRHDTMPVSGSFELAQNYPNPFNESTRISLHLRKGSDSVRLIISDLLGRTIRSWDLTGQQGEFEMIWSCDNEGGFRVPSGVYMVRLIHGQSVETRKMILLR